MTLNDDAGRLICSHASIPRTMSFAHELDSMSSLNFPFDVGWNAHDFKMRTVTIRSRSQLLYHCDQLLVVSRDTHSKPIEAGFILGRCGRPIAGGIIFLEGVLLTKLSQAEKGFVAEAEFSVARINDNLFDGLFHDVPPDLDW